ncbi:MAG: hypothetical protein Q7J29_02635 [Stagnimonas sp.]|nr:hypothetical protein [Stagnimonas sp.]
MPNLSHETISIIFWSLMVVALVLIIAGSNNKIVVFYNGLDMRLSFGSGLSLFICHALLDSTRPNYLWALFFGAIGLSLALISVVAAIRHNRSIFLGLLVGIFKLAFSFFAVLSIFSQLSTAIDEKSSRNEAIGALAMAALIGLIAAKLINGEQVYLEKGWPLPELS